MSTEPDLLEEKPISVRRRLLILSGVIVVALTGLGVGNWYLQNSHTRSKLASVEAMLDVGDPGWRLDDMEAARPAVPEASNSARVVVAVNKLLPRNWPEEPFDGRFRDEHFPPALLDPDRRKLLAGQMKSVAPALAEARKLADLPHGRHKLVLGRNPLSVNLQDQQDTRRVGMLLRYDAWDRALDGDLPGAMRAARAGINAGRSIGDEPFAVSQIARNACVVMALLGLERSLALGEPPDADLARVQDLLALEDGHPTALLCARGERAVVHALFDRLLSGEIPQGHMFDGGLFSKDPSLTWSERIFGISPREIRREQAIALELLTKLVDGARLPEHMQLSAEAYFVAEADTVVREKRARLVGMTLPAMTNVNKGFRRKQAQVRCMLALVAAERHRRKAGRWPDKLDDLAPALLPTVPRDPHGGKALRYKRTADGVVVYSVGEDGRDNGGAINRERVAGPGLDLGYELWDVKKRRQPAKAPPPLPPDAGGPNS